MIPQEPGKKWNKWQFFHQTFFDYCYARTFVNRYNSLINDVVLPQHQGLFIRSQVKQVLSYLRGSDLQRYLTELRAFLTHRRIRFHIWLLVVNQLASVEDPTDEEWLIVKSRLDTHPNFRAHFLEAIQSGWLKYLIDSGILRSFLESSSDRLFNLTIWKLGDLINKSPETVVDFLADFPDIENKAEYICGSILLRLDIWEYEKAIRLFEQYLPTFKTFSERHPYYQVMKSVFPYQPELVCKIFFEDLHQRVDSIPSADEFDKRHLFDHEDIDLLQKIQEQEKTKDTALSEGLAIICKLIEKTKMERKRTDFYYDGAFLFIEKFGCHLHTHWEFFALVREQLIEVARRNRPHFLELVDKFETSLSYTLLKLLIQGYLADPESYVKEGFALLTRPGVLENLTGDDSGGHDVRKLLRTIYPYLSLEQKDTLNSIKQFHELERKFGQPEEESPIVSELVEVGPPLPKEAYEKMTEEQWLASFRKYDESTGWDQPQEDILKGGIVEHSRAFTEQVSKRPDDRYDFIFSLGKQEDIPKVYLEAGIRGLVEAKYDIQKVTKLVKKYWKYPDSGFRRMIVQAIDYINKQNTLDLELISILEEYVLHDPEPTQESWMIDAGGGTPYYGGDPVDSGINTVRGAAAWRLAIHGYKTPYPDKVFDIMEQIANDPFISVRCCVIANLQGMLNWDRERTYHIFMKLTHDKHPKVIKEGLQCLGYLMTEENFTSFVPHLKIAMGIDEHHGYHHVGEYVGQILMLAYVRKYSNSKELLEEGFQVSDHIKAGAVRFASKHLLEPDKEVAKKSQEIYLRFLDEGSEDISRMYNHMFYSFSPKDFNRLYRFVRPYTTSKVSHYEAFRFFDYLVQCVSFEPEKCIDLIQNYINFEQPDSQQRSFMRRDTHVQILIGAYSKPISYDYKEKVMNIFDKILQDQAYKREGLKVLTEQDRG